MRHRVDQVRALLEPKGWDAILITDQDNRYFVSGYRADDHSGRSAGILIITGNDALLLTNPNNVDWARSVAPSFDVVETSGPWEHRASEILTDRSVRRIAIESATLPHASYVRLAEQMSNVELLDIGDSIDRLRWVKTAAEIERHRTAIEITDATYAHACELIREGVTERALARSISMEFLRLGADGAGFSPAVAFGENAAKPHHDPTDRELRPGEAIIIDIGAQVDGYTADLTRTNWLGTAPALLEELYTIVEHAQAAALDQIRAGVPANLVDAAARRVIADAGYGDRFVHGVGHGIGIRIHDGPFLNARNEDPLPANSVLTVEPGIYIRDFGGVRIEDVVLVTDTGFELLTAAPKTPQL